MTTIVDVAREAGVSTTTVSHVINATRYVHPDTEKAVRQAIDKLGYIPNTLARALTGAKQHIIGVMIPALNNQYFHQTLHWIDASCRQHKMMTIYADHQENADYELQIVQSLHQRRVDGILLAPSADCGKTLDYIRKHKIPTVLLDRFPAGDFDTVGTENYHAVMQMVEHLFDHGHERIAYIQGHPHISTTEMRISGFIAAFEKRGIDKKNATIIAGNSDLETTYQALTTLLSDAGTNAKPTAIFTGNNVMTMGALKALRDANLSIPDDMALVGFDDFELADIFQPPLTLIAQPLQAIGEQAVAHLLKRIETPNAPPQHLQIPPQLKIRASCGCRT